MVTPCQKCKDKSCQHTGKPCKKIEKTLKDKGIYSAEYIRPKMPSHKRKDFGKWREIPFSMLKFKESLYDGSNFK